MSKRTLTILSISLLALLIFFWPSNKLHGRFITLIEPNFSVASRPVYKERYPSDFLWWIGGEFVCTKTNIYVTNFFGTKERIFSDNHYQKDELGLFLLSPDRMHAIGQFSNQTCGGADEEYTYFQYIDLYNSKTIQFIDKGNSILAYSGNILFSPDSKLIAYLNKDAIFVFNTKDGSTKKLIKNLEVEPLAVFDTNEEYQRSELSHNPFTTSALNSGKYMYQPKRNLAWKDNVNIYYYYDLVHDPVGFYSVNVSTSEVKKIPNYTYKQYQQLKKQNTRHQLGIIEYPIEDSSASENYNKRYCKYAAHYSFCQI